MWSHRIGATTKLPSLRRLLALPHMLHNRMQDPLLLWAGQTRQTARKRGLPGCSPPYAATTSTTLLARRLLHPTLEWTVVVRSGASAGQATAGQLLRTRPCCHVSFTYPLYRETQIERFTRAPPTRHHSHNVPRRVDAEHQPVRSFVRWLVSRMPVEREPEPHGWRAMPRTDAHAHAVQCHAMLLASLLASGSMPRCPAQNTLIYAAAAAT